MSVPRKPQILVIDDDKDWRDRVSLSLEGEGYAVSLAKTHQEALKLLKGDAIFNLICMNIVLQGTVKDAEPGWRFDWTTLMREAKTRGIKALVITALNSWVSLKDIYDTAAEFGVGAKEIFFKSDITINKLLEKVETIIPQKIEDNSISKADFDVFLSYNHKDRLIVEKIAQRLKEHNLNPWLDQEQILGGRSFQDDLQNAISKAESAAIFIGTNGLGDWQIPEAQACYNRFVQDRAGFPVIPVLLPGVNEIPPNLLFLKELHWVSFESGVDDSKAFEKLVLSITEKYST